MLGNAWLIGIFTGLVSGLIVMWLSRFIVSKKDNKEYQRKLEIANNEIIYSIRPSVAEKVFPKKEVINSIIISTARKYDVNTQDLYNMSMLSEDIVKEIMDNPFLSSLQKEEFTSKLIISFKDIPSDQPTPDNQPEKQLIKSSSDSMLSITLALVTLIITALSSFLLQISSRYSIFPNPFLLLGPLLIVIIVVFALSIASIFVKRISIKNKLLRKYNIATEQIHDKPTP